ncbi:hypothetical protein DL546_000603 [Coniochaeta pulveracea]|uniref:Heterokaryon incompatibility domain-containing protein n=1 Tax=Coniochaeta pulveracea TaxID=177199 RepID=A0A420YLM9_9PEZI|nr:hypothetical protein DL546_000603 [Coniochaeta pulveracea]
MDSSSLSKTTTSALYGPLADAEFRTLVLFPGVLGDPIRVRLRLDSLDSDPEYDALSYVWGDPHHTIDILCNDLPTPITTNLHAALVRVRSPLEPRILWADALCINQQDKAERGHQVSLMGRIYSSARLVLAYMGSSPGHAGGRAISSLLLDCTPNMGESRPDTKDPRWKSLGPLFDNSWFTRAWVVQEVGLAKNPRILYDEADVSYRQLMSLVTWLYSETAEFAQENHVLVPSIHVLCPDWRDAWYHFDTPLVEQVALVDLLEWGIRLACQDPRDHIYAFLGHPLAKSNNGAIIPDYEKEVFQVYKEVTEYLLAETGIRALSSGRHTTASLSDPAIPSWVLRWGPQSISSANMKGALPFFCACGDRVEAQIHQDNDALLIRGLEVDMVKDVYRIEADDSARLLTFAHWSDTQALSLEEIINSTISNRYSDSDSQAQDLAWTLCAGLASGETGGPAFPLAWIAYRSWARSPSTYDKMPRLADLFWGRCQH